MVAPGLPAISVHALLDDCPAAVIGDDEAVQIEIEAVLNCGAVDLGDEPAHFAERRAIEADPIADCSKLVRRLPGMLAASATDVDAQFSRERCHAALEGTDDACGDAGRVPVHAHHRAEGLEPEGVSETPQQFVATILKDDRLADDGTQAGHAIAQPFGHSTTVERKICATGASTISSYLPAGARTRK